MVNRSNSKEYSFLEALGIERGDVVCFSGAGGKTSLMLRLAKEARGQSLKVLVTTSTKILVPDVDQYDALDLSGKLRFTDSVATGGIYVGGLPTVVAGKMTGVAMELLCRKRRSFELILIEADGAATKPLKGWNSTEPVIPEFASKTIGVLDIQTIGSIICEALIHRLEFFCKLTGSTIGEPVSIRHLCRMILHHQGLFHQSQGTKIIYINKVESEIDRSNVDNLRTQLKNTTIVAGSIRQGTIYV